MSADLFERATALFEQALERPIAERDAFVVAGSREDQKLLDRVRAMLSADERWSPLLDATPDNLAAAVTVPPPVLEGRRFGPYVVREVIGRGGMGIVCLAEREDVGKRVALKLVSGALGSPERVARFLTERRVLAQLQHPHIVPLLDAGAADDGTPWLAMEYVPGQAIDAYCETRGLSLEQRLSLFERVCGAVGYAHQHLIIHRDLKPSNVLVGEDGEPRLLDFGIAKLLSDTDDRGGAATGTGVSLMTPQYASPEQLRGEPISTASDIYQLGALLFQLLTGCEPHPKRHDRSALQPAVAVPRPSQAGADRRGGTGVVPARRLVGDLDLIVLKATDQDPGRRYRTVEQLADDVRRHLDGRPILAQPPRGLYLLRKFVARNRAGTGVFAAAVLAVVGFVAAMVVQTRRVQVQRSRADEVAALLIDVFAGADPSVAQGDTITVRGVLDRGTTRIRVNRTIAPEVKARLLDVIAQAYGNLGQTKQSIALETEAQTLLTTSVPPNDAERLGSLERLSAWLSEVGEHRTALALAQQASLVGRTLPSSRRAQMADILANEGYVRQIAGDLTGARTVYEEALINHRAASPQGKASLEKTLVNLGYLAQGRGDRATAQALFTEVLGARRTRLGADHSATAKSMMDLAGVLTETGQLDSAEALLREAIATHRRVFTTPHVGAISGLTAMALLLGRRGRFAEAETTQREVLTIARQLYGDSSTGAAMAVANLAGYVQRQNRLDDAAALHRDAVLRLTAATGARSASTAVAMTNLAWTEHLRRRSVQAEALYRQALPMLDSAWMGTTRIASALADYAIVLRALDKCDVAEPLVRRSLALASTDRPKTSADVLRPTQVLGTCLGRLGKYAEAESLLTVAYRTLLESQGARNMYTIDAARELARVYDLQGKGAEAARLRLEAEGGTTRR
jgi:serine/threonine-protein kinase